MKLTVLSDTHYTSRRMLADYNDTDALNDIAVSEQALKQACVPGATVLITGDLTDGGDVYSHAEFASLLEKYSGQGTKIYVIFATHDFHHHRAWVKKRGVPASADDKKADMPWCRETDFENPQNFVRAAAPEEVWKLYYKFGPAQARSVCEESFSYCVDLDENTRCLMLNDIFRNEEALHDISASFTPTCLRWIEKMKKEADRDGKFIFACSHHPLIPTTPAHCLLAGPRNLRTPYTAHLLADIGINLCLVGHTHAVDTGFAVSKKGNSVFTVMTPCVREFPPQYREVDINGSEGKITYNTVDIETPLGVQIENNDLNAYYRKRIYDSYYGKTAGKNNFTGRLLRKLTLGHTFFLINGGAKLTKEEKAEIKKTKFFDFVMSLVFSILSGDGPYMPGTAYYKYARGLAAFADSIIFALPFINLHKKLAGYTAWQMIEPMLYKQNFSDRADTVDFTAPVKDTAGEPAKSGAGIVFCVLTFILMLILSPAAAAAAPFVFLVKSIMKQVRKKAPVPENIYYYDKEE